MVELRYNLAHAKSPDTRGKLAEQDRHPSKSRKRKGQVHASPVHRHHGDDQERGNPGSAVRGSVERRDHVRRIVDRRVRANRRIRHVSPAGPLDLQHLPLGRPSGERVARIICDIYTPEGTPFVGCPRTTLKRVIELAAARGYSMNAGPEAEFFLFQAKNGVPTTETHDAAGYFDLSPVDMGEDVRREIVLALEAMGFHVEAAHHEVAPGQHEIDFRYDDVLTTADSISTFRFVVKNIAIRNGLHATFMPKPIYGINGSGMHTHMSLFSNGANIFFDAKAPRQLSEICLNYIGGILRHAKGFCAITNPLVNSYKRLVPGYEAPTNIAWSEKNRSPLVRVPAARGRATRIELRMPDPACNPYLALAVMLRAGLDGIDKKIDPGPPINKNIF